MNLQTHISPELWQAIASPYGAGHYTHAVLEAVHHLTAVLRDRSGADGDGVALVGQALGGDAPKLRVNSLQSESERNVQKGLENILRGVYLAIRNPRSHEQCNDPQEDADAIIHFVDYLLRILNASKEAFTLEGFMNSVADPEFVESQRYAELLTNEVPANRRGDALAALFGARLTVELRKRRFLVETLLSLLSDTQLAQYLVTVSDELRTATEGVAIRTALQMITPDLWPRISEAPRLRIENKLIRDIRQGEIRSDNKVIGSLGTWASAFVAHFSLRAEGAASLIAKLEYGDACARHYVGKYFLYYMPQILTEEREVTRAIRAIATAIRKDDAHLREAVIGNVQSFPAAWQSQMVEGLKDLTDATNPAVVLDDGTPFLAAPTATEGSDDLIPF